MIPQALIRRHMHIIMMSRDQYKRPLKCVERAAVILSNSSTNSLPKNMQALSILDLMMSLCVFLSITCKA